jgi:hypothetical protein
MFPCVRQCPVDGARVIRLARRVPTHERLDAREIRVCLGPLGNRAHELVATSLLDPRAAPMLGLT